MNKNFINSTEKIKKVVEEAINSYNLNVYNLAVNPNYDVSEMPEDVLMHYDIADIIVYLDYVASFTNDAKVIADSVAMDIAAVLVQADYIFFKLADILEDIDENIRKSFTIDMFIIGVLIDKYRDGLSDVPAIKDYLDNDEDEEVRSELLSRVVNVKIIDASDNTESDDSDDEDDEAAPITFKDDYDAQPSKISKELKEKIDAMPSIGMDELEAECKSPEEDNPEKYFIFGSDEDNNSIYDLTEEGKQQTKLTIPNGVTTIGVEAFSDNENIETVVIPDSVKEINSGAFWGCTSLKSVTLPEGIVVIDDDTFRDCKSLKNVILPKSLKKIGKNAFYECRNLEEINLPESINDIGESAFRGCDELVNLSFPDSLINIGYSAFRECTSLRKVSIPNSVLTIDKYAFDGCSSITEVVLGSKIREIKYDTFANCVSLKTVHLPYKIKSIDMGAFVNCINLSAVVFRDCLYENFKSFKDELYSYGLIDMADDLNYAFAGTRFFNRSY